MAKRRSFQAGSVYGGVITVGDHNRVDATVMVTFGRDELPKPHDVDIVRELAALRDVLGQVAGEDRSLVEGAIAEAEGLAKKPTPPKDRIGDALGRAVRYAGDAEKLAGSAEKLWPTLKAIAGWLGEHGPKMLRLAGIGLL